MIIKAHFDGHKVLLLDDESLKDAIPGEAIVILPEPSDLATEMRQRLKAQEPIAARIWENDADTIYDAL